jgi:hypothetical protein
MNHPERETWIPYLFGEANSKQQQELDTHLNECVECREQLEQWQRSLHRLDEWRLPAVEVRTRRFQAFAPLMQLAAAAAVVLCLGYGLGHVTAKPDVTKLRAALEPQIRKELHAQLDQILDEKLKAQAASVLASAIKHADEIGEASALALTDARAEDHQAILSAFDKFDTQRATDLLSLKKQLDTLAVNTDLGLRETQQRVAQFANYSQPAN